MVKVKVCGIKRVEDALYALELGADYIGIILYPKSPRFAPPELRREIIRETKGAKRVAVMVNPSRDEVLRVLDEGFELVQLHGEESITVAKEVGLDRVIKAFRVRKKVPNIDEGWKDGYAVLLDTYSEKSYGGTGKSFNWEIAKEVVGKGFKLFLSGGLNPENVKKAVSEVKPYAVDVSSGVESEPGVKDKIKLKRFIEEAKSL